MAEPEDDVYFGPAWESGESLVLKQGFESVSHDGLQKIVYKDWGKRLKRAGIAPTRILSKAAKSIILADLQRGTYNDRANANEPAIMTPSTDPTKYSLWCSFCYDFGETLLLCAGCRVGLCTGGSKSCIVWDPMIHKEDFVFFCPYCAKTRAQSHPLKLAEPTKVPEKWGVLFRYDPAVLIVSIRWHGTKHSFGKLARDRLFLSYANNEASVMLIERSLECSPTSNDKFFKRSKDTSLAENFLKKHKAAKIIVIVDTHCLENGYFVWTGDSPQDYRACSLLEILRDCSPKGIFQYLSNAENTPTHNHKSLILNLACGPSISQIRARSELLNGHNADAVLSLANNATVVSEVSAKLLDLVAYWVQTFSDYDILIPKVMTCDWAKEHMPVLSRHGHNPARYTTFISGDPPAPIPITSAPGQDDHILFTKFNFGQPGGRVVLCHERCDQEVLPKQTKAGVRMECVGCGSKCTIPQFKTTQTTPLERHAFVAVKYPQDQYPAVWGPSKKGDSKLIQPPPKATRSQAVLLHSPAMMKQTTSLPTTIAPTTTPKSSSPSFRIRIRIPATRSTPSLSLPGPLGAEGIRSATATPPPPSPQETPNPRKRSIAELRSEIMQQRRQYKNTN